MDLLELRAQRDDGSIGRAEYRRAVAAFQATALTARALSDEAAPSLPRQDGGSASPSEVALALAERSMLSGGVRDSAHPGLARFDESDEVVQHSALTPGKTLYAAKAAGASGFGDSTAQNRADTRPDFRTRKALESLRKTVDYSADASAALNNLRRLAITEFRVVAYDLGPDGVTDVQNDVATMEAERLAKRSMVSHEGGGIRAMMSVGLDALATGGGLGSELNVSESLDRVLNIGLASPGDVDFKTRGEGVARETVPVYVDSQGELHDLNLLQFRYAGLDTSVDRPHGKPWFASLLDTAVPQAEMRNTLQAVVKQAGFGRLTASIDWERLTEQMPASVKTAAELTAFLDTALNDVADSLADLQPDDAIVTPDFVTLGYAGAAHGGQSFKPAELAAVYDTDVAAAVHTPLSLLGRSSGNALSTNTDVHWQVYALSIEALRGLVNDLIQWALTQALRIQGMPVSVVVEWEPVRRDDALADAEADKANTESMLALYEAGIIDAATVRDRLGLPDPVETGLLPPAPESGSRASARLYADIEADYIGRTCASPVDDESGGVDRLDVFDSTGRPLAATELYAEAEVTDEDNDGAAERGRAMLRRIAPEFELIFLAETIRADEDAERAGRGVTYDWDPTAVRYRYSTTGRLVPRQRMVRLAGQIRDEHKLDMRRHTEKYTAGKIDVQQWQRSMTRSLKDAHLQTRQLAVGGRANMTPRHNGSVGGSLRVDYRHLSDFANKVARGEMSAAQVLARVDLYSEANLRRQFERGELAASIDAGLTQERRVLQPAEHCVGCSSEAGLSWQPIGTLAPIGGHECGARDHCQKEYR